MSLPDRRSLVERGHPRLSVVRQSELLGVSRSGLYCGPRVSGEDVLAMNAIDAIYTACPFYGSRRVRVELGWSHGICACRDRVRRLIVSGSCFGVRS